MGRSDWGYNTVTPYTIGTHVDKKVLFSRYLGSILGFLDLIPVQPNQKCIFFCAETAAAHYPE